MILLRKLVVIFKPQLSNFFLNEKHNGTTYKLQSSFLMKKKQRKKLINAKKEDPMTKYC